MLPKQIMVDLEDYRGFQVVAFPLKVEHINGKFVSSYSHDGAQYAIAVYWAENKNDAIRKMEDFIKRNGIKENKIYSSSECARMT